MKQCPVQPCKLHFCFVKMKKGMVSYLNVLIISVVVLIVMLTITKIVTDGISSSAKIGKCSASLLKSSLIEELSVGAAGVVSPGFLNINCNNLPDLTIKKSDVSVKNKIKDDAVKKVIADKMVECWKMVGKGLIDPYKTYDGHQTYCLICSDVIFDKDFVEAAKEQNYDIKDNIYWLATNPMPGVKPTYFEDLSGIKPDPSQIRGLKEKEVPIDVSKQYTVIWRMAAVKKDLITDLVSGAVGGSVAGVVGGVVGSAIGTVLIPVPVLGTTVGGLVGAALIGGAGAVGGTYGAIKLTNNIVKDVGTVSSQILVIPKLQLGQTYDENGAKKDFCTKLVNY